MNRGDCKICEHREVKRIHELLLTGTPISQIPTMFNDDFHRVTLSRHIKTCLKSSHYQLTREQKIKNAQDADDRYQYLVQQAEEVLEASKEVMLVNGSLNSNPRSWEIEVVYKHPFIKDAKGNPAIMTDSLENVIELLNENSIEVTSSRLKIEDFRKTYRESIKLYKELLETYFKIFGALKAEPNKFEEELEQIRSTIKHVANKLNQSYRSQLQHFLEVYGQRTRKDLRDALMEELSMLNSKITPPYRGMP